ncbi:sodium/phosphate symporter [Haladaptatus sp. W1]|uniref:sodium/phosphate symporter n=1 Tax=Haladaptatus sp. W1 TaxID=1897478 RepID=UPI000849A11E|nr:sodium/phosphate symporter [Haladaptatus sp. W1]ODR79822.1 sodium/phosphate symporter [Haladaptatus sp. W1]
MRRRRSVGLVSLAVVLIALAMRTIPLYWSPLAFNVDGFKFARLARETVRHGYLPVSTAFLNPDEYTFSTLLAICSQLTGIEPLYVAQLLTASIGATACLFVVVVTRRIGFRLRWSRFDVRIAAFVAGVVLATNGIFLGRSTAVTSEGLGLVFIILGIVAFARTLRTNSRSWMVVTGLVLVLLPLTHNLSTIVGGFAIVSLLALSLRSSVDKRGLLMMLVVAGFWTYVSVYYTTFKLNELSQISSAPGLFVAWVIVLVLLTVWLSRASPRIQRDLPSVVLLGGAGLITANAVTPIFPGTATTDKLVFVYVLPIALVGIVAIHGIPRLVGAGLDGSTVFALLLGTLSIIGFALTGGLTVPYQDLAIRAQTFIHVPFAVLAGVGVILLTRRSTSRSIQAALIVVVLLCSVVSAPLAFSGLRATSAQPLVTQPEFETATFATTYADGWTSDGHMTRLAFKYYPKQTDANVSQLAVYEWLHGGKVPSCPVVSQQSWTTVGAQLFPSSPTKISPDSYATSSQTRNLVYSNSGTDPLIFTIPTTGRKRCNS